MAQIQHALKKIRARARLFGALGFSMHKNDARSPDGEGNEQENTLTLQDQFSNLQIC